MPSGNEVWGIDIGQCALKAIKLRAAGDGKVEAVAFDVIEHPKILSQPDADPDELINAALEKFASRNDWQGDQFVVGVPGQQTFARFCKMPPIDLKKDSKKINDLVKYEAMQQIPFDMEDVVWDYQVFMTKDSPDVEVGIFAMRKDLIRKQIDFLTRFKIAPAAIQTIPCALYNFARFDLPNAADENSATVLIDVGAQNTDLVIVEPNSAWTRNIPLGGNSFTEALVRAFKLSFAKAESLKRTAATSKYARQIFQAMRPVFADLVAEIQRSIGFYSSTHRDVELKRVIALGNAFRLTGLQKYLENNLTIGGGVIKLERFEQVVPSATINAPQFTENILSFGASYGLALQGLNLAKIQASLLPAELARIAVWKKKRPYFIAAAASLAFAATIPWVRNELLDKPALGSADNPKLANAENMKRKAQNLQSEYSRVQGIATQQRENFKKLEALQSRNRMIPLITAMIHEALPQVDEKVREADTPEKFAALVKLDPKKYERPNRKQIEVETFKIIYVPDVTTADLMTVGQSSDMSTSGSTGAVGVASRGGEGPVTVTSSGGGGGGGVEAPSQGDGTNGGFVVRVEGRLLYGGQNQSAAVRMLTEELYPKLRALGARPGLGFHIPSDAPPPGGDPSTRPPPSLTSPPTLQKMQQQVTGSAQQISNAVPPEFVDPRTGEDIRTDWRFSFAIRVKLGDAPPPADAAAPK